MLEKFTANHVWIEGRRCQEFHGKIYPGVTTVLSATKSERDKLALDKWRQNVGEIQAEKIQNDACDRGSEIHNLIENYLVGVEKLCSEAHKGFWDSIRPVLKHVSKVELIEGAVWHPVGFAGSVDCVGYWDGELSIIDWKTASKPKRDDWILDYKLQTSAYCAAVNRLYNLRINKAVVAIALENQEAQVFKINPKDLITYWNMFKLRVKEYHQKYPLKDYIPLKNPCVCGSTLGVKKTFIKKQFNRPSLHFHNIDCANCGKYLSILAS